MVCGVVAEHVIEAPGASDVTGQVVAPAVGSVTARALTVTLPVFLTRNDHWIVSPRSVAPSWFTSVTAADLVSWRVGVCVAVTVAVDGTDVTGPPVGGVPVAVAELRMVPASRSAWVVEYDAVHVVDAPGTNEVVGQVTVSGGPAGAVNVSPTEMPVRETLPVFLTTNE